MPTWSATPASAPKVDAAVGGPVRCRGAVGLGRAQGSPAPAPAPAPSLSLSTAPETPVWPRPPPASASRQAGALPRGALRLQGLEQAAAQVGAGQAGRPRARTRQARSSAAGGAHRLILHASPLHVFCVNILRCCVKVCFFRDHRVLNLARRVIKRCYLRENASEALELLFTSSIMCGAWTRETRSHTEAYFMWLSKTDN